MWMRTGILLLTSVLAFTSRVSAQSPTDHASLHLPFKLQGSGSPTVVFEAGAGEKLDTWDPVQFEVSKLTRTYAYSRRGYTGALMTGHRDATTIVEELRADLRDRQIAPPYVLVGHSIGGLYVQAALFECWQVLAERLSAGGLQS